MLMRNIIFTSSRGARAGLNPDFWGDNSNKEGDGIGGPQCVGLGIINLPF